MPYIGTILCKFRLIGKSTQLLNQALDTEEQFATLE